MNFIKLLILCFMISIITYGVAYADLISDENKSKIENALKSEISSYDDLVELHEIVKKLENDNTILKNQVEELKSSLEQKNKQESDNKELNNKINSLFLKSKNHTFSTIENIDNNYDKALVAIEAMSLNIAKKYLSLVIKDEKQIKIDPEISSMIRSKANLLLGMIFKIQSDNSTALSYFSSSYTLANSPDISLLSLEEIMGIFFDLDKKKELCTTYNNYKENLNSISLNKLSYDTTLMNKKFIAQVSKLCTNNIK